VPVLSPPIFERLYYDTSFEAWKKRTYLFHYRGIRGKEYSTGSGVLHKVVYGLRDLFPDSVIENAYAPSTEHYANELVDSKFCLIVRGDDPHRSRFNEAVVAGCIPVLINDGWALTVAPFSTQIHYESFTRTIPESMFLAHPTSALYFAYGISEARLKKMHAALLEHRPFVNWGWNDRSIGKAAWEAIDDECDW
jgi:hypothetical protein